MVHFFNQTIHQRFLHFHKQHPEVYKSLLHLTIQAQLAGRKRIGIKSLWEKLRWDYALDPQYQHMEMQLSNDFTSRYARMIVHEVPYLKGIFQIRDLRRV
jgi:hypothetical protein